MESQFQNVPVLVAGPSYLDRSRPLSSQETRNFYHEVVESGKDNYVLKSFPGQKLLGSTTAGADRGSHQMKEVGYRVVGTTLYEVSSLGVHTSRGTISGLERCIFADDGVNLFITTGGVISHYENVTNTLVTVTDPDIVGALSVAFINNQFAYTFANQTVFSDVGDGSSASGLNAIGAESNPDDLVRDYVFDQVLWRCGKRVIEPWWNSGVGTPPFERIEGQILQIGLGATHCITNTKNFIYFLGSDRQIYRARDGQETPVSTAAISGAIQGYASVSEAFSYSFTIDDKTFVLFTFPSANRTWCLNEELGKNGWFELSQGIGTGKYNANSIVEVYNKVLVGGNSDGKMFELDFETYDEGGSPWRRRRVMTSINGGILGQKGHLVEMSRMEFILEAGVGLITGQGEDPQIMLEASYDGGRSWATGTWLKIGRLGEFTQRAEWFNMKSFTDLMVRLTTSDPVAFNLYSATIDLRLAGR